MSVELVLIVHADDGLGHFGEPVEFLPVAFVVTLKFHVQPELLVMKFFPEATNDVLHFFIDLELERVDVFFDGVEVELLFLLPLQQSLVGLVRNHFLVNLLHRFLAALYFCAQLLYSSPDLNDCDLMPVVLLFVLVCGEALLAKEGRGFATNIGADAGDGPFGMVEAWKSEAGEEGILKHGRSMIII